MPIKWTPENDQILLLKILETCNVTANVKAIAEAWPDDRDRPSARAISERLFKIRHSTKSSNGTASMTVSNGSKDKGSTPSKSSQRTTKDLVNVLAKELATKEVLGKHKRNVKGGSNDATTKVSVSPTTTLKGDAYDPDETEEEDFQALAPTKKVKIFVAGTSLDLSEPSFRPTTKPSNKLEPGKANPYSGIVDQVSEQFIPKKYPSNPNLTILAQAAEEVKGREWPDHGYGGYGDAI